MAKKEEKVEVASTYTEPVTVKKESILPLTIDYPHEYLNDIARKINELIERM